MSGTVLAAAFAAACGSAAAPPATPVPSPTTPVPTDVVQITGRERIGWSQSTTAISDLHFAMYVDTVTRVDLKESTCNAGADSIYECDSPLPTLTKGKHSLELTAWVDAAGSPLESGRTTPLNVEVTGGSALTAPTAEFGVSTMSSPSERAPSAGALYSGCGVMPGWPGALVTWDATGTIQVADRQSAGGRKLQWAKFDDDQWTLTGMALHPRVAATGWMYLAEVGSGPRPQLRIVRFRKSGDVLGERAVLFQQGLANRPARIRLWADTRDRLYVALLESNSGVPSAATPHPFLIRLTADGHVPPENDAGAIFTAALAVHPIDVAFRADGGLPVLVEQTGAHTYTAATAGADLARQAPSFTAASLPIAALFGGPDGDANLSIVTTNGELLGLEETPSGWSRTAERPLVLTRRTSADAVLVAPDEMAMCGPARAGTSESSTYEMWRVRLRN